MLSILEPSQSNLPVFYKKPPTSFLVDDVKFEIYYFRSSWRPAGLTTADEITPYVFIKDKFVAIGWPSFIGSNLSPQNREITIRFDTQSGRMNYGFGKSWNNRNIFMGPYKHDAYGPGIHSDAIGRPFQWETENDDKVLGPVKKDAYSVGMVMDQYGRPVKPGPLP